MEQPAIRRPTKNRAGGVPQDAAPVSTPARHRADAYRAAAAVTLLAVGLLDLAGFFVAAGRLSDRPAAQVLGDVIVGLVLAVPAAAFPAARLARKSTTPRRRRLGRVVLVVSVALTVLLLVAYTYAVFKSE